MVSISAAEVDAAISGGFRPDERSAPVQAFAGENAGELIPQSLVLAVHVSDLAAADADVSCRNVGIRTDVPAQLRHEALAKSHDLVIAFAFRIEIGSAFSSAHRQRGQAVLENLLEGQEFQNSQIDRRMEAETALVGADRAVHLDAESAIDLDFSLVVHPGHTERNDPFRFHHAFENFGGSIFGMPVQHQRKRLDNFLDSLVKFGLAGFFGLQASHKNVYIIYH